MEARSVEVRGQETGAQPVNARNAETWLVSRL